MALPEDLQLCTLTGIYRSLVDGSPVHVKVKIEPQFKLLRDLPGGADSGDTGSNLIDPPTVEFDTSNESTGDGSAWAVTTSGDGEFSVKLVGYVDVELVTPTKFQYKITVSRKSDDSLIATYGPDLEAGVTVDISTLTPNFKAVPSQATSVVNVGGGGGVSSWDDLEDKPAVIAAGASETAAREAIGAGTSNLSIGTTSTTAKAGDWKPDWTNDVTGKPATFPPSAHTTQPADIVGSTAYGQGFLSLAAEGSARVKIGATPTGESLITAADSSAVAAAAGLSTAAADIATLQSGKANAADLADVATSGSAADLSGVLPVAGAPVSSLLIVTKQDGAWPARPSSRDDVVVAWRGPNPDPDIVSSGTGGMRDGIDLRWVTP